MSEDQKLQLANQIDKVLEEKRRAAWGGLGVQIYHEEIALQLIAQEITSDLITPIETKDIEDAEKSLAKVKALLKNFIERRKQTTSKFDNPIARLMGPEKGIQEAIDKNIVAIINAKRLREEETKTKENKAKELIQIAEQVRIYVADMHSAKLEALAKLISDAYKYALNTNISIDQIQAYVDKVSGRVTESNQTAPPPKPTFKYNTQEDVDKCIAENFKPWTGRQYVEGFAIDIKNKFTDWELALKNKPQAEKINIDEFNTTLSAIADEKEKVVVGAKLESISSPIAESTDVKTLKYIYKISEPQTLDEAFLIMNAFIVNKKICVPALSKIKPINLSIKQMMGALEDIKNKDENFEVTGIKFNKTEKL